MARPVDISVIIPCRDAMEHLPDAIASVHAALDGRAFEIVAADGGSSDGTQAFLAEAGVRIAGHSDNSIYDGLNKALAASSGRYVLWLNADDRVETPLRELLAHALATDACLATGEAAMVDAQRTIWTSDHHRRRMDRASVLFGNPTINSRLVRRDLYERAGPFRTDVGLAGDREMMLRLLGHAIRRESFPQTVYSYGVHPQSRTMAGTWTSYAAVHEANMALAAALRDPEHRTEDAAFMLISAAAAARAHLFEAAPGRALGRGMKAARLALSPRILRRAAQAMKLRPLASGW